MKYNTLLTGTNRLAIDEFFLHMDDTFYCMTTSLRYEDMVRHLRMMKPDFFVLCLSSEGKDDISRMVALKEECKKQNTFFVIYGTQEDCEYFKKIAFRVADITLQKPINTSSIIAELTGYMNVNRKAQQVEMDVQVEAGKSSEAEDAAMKLAADILGDVLQEESEEASGKKHVLVVDDDPKMLKLIRRYLEGKYDVATAVNGKLAFRFLEKKKTDLILLDYEMPGESGAQVLAKLRANDMTKGLPVIFLTGISDREKIAEVLAYNPQGYLLKPIDRGKLLEALEGHLA